MNKIKYKAKLLSVIIAVAMVTMMLPLTVMAATTVTNVTVYIYEASNDYHDHFLASVSGTPSVTALDALEDADSSIDLDSDTWIFTVDDEISSVSAGEYDLSGGEKLSFYKVSNYLTDAYATLAENTLLVVDGCIKVESGINYDLHARQIGFNMDKPYVRDNSSLSFKNASGSAITAVSSSVSEVYVIGSTGTSTVCTGYYPVDVVDYDDYSSEINSQLSDVISIAEDITSYEISSSDFTQLSSLITIAQNASGTNNKLVAMVNLGEKLYEMTRTTDPRIETAAFSNGLATTVPFDPDITDYDVEPTNGSSTYYGSRVTLSLTAIDDANASISISANNSASLVSGTTYQIQTGTTTFTATVTNGSASRQYTFEITAASGGSGDADVYAFLPAPGQFVNERMDTNPGGWTDIYKSDGSIKLEGNPVGTGVSLGSFGGYVVFKFDSDVSNSSTNKYGADFIVYGNAFWGNSEAGCIQVAQDINGVPGDANSDGTVWYDIAGSDYYESDTDNDYEVTYANPTPADNDDTDCGTLASVPYTTDNWSNNGNVTKNMFHNHGWFPLEHFYMESRTINSTTCPALDKISSLPFVSYAIDQDITYDNDNNVSTTVNDTETVTYNGVKITQSGTSSSGQFNFGYCDAHPNKTSNYSIAYNPYSLGDVTSSSGYNTAVSGTGGGDPIDISWAVDENGEPVSLSDIRFVRIYTGSQQMNGMFGEISTEVLGIKEVTNTGTGSASLPDIEIDDVDLEDWADDPDQIENMGTVDITEIEEDSITIEITGGTYVYMNGSKTTSLTVDLSDEEVHYVRIISQSGTAEPYIILLKLQY